jgi:hypothetical protein
MDNGREFYGRKIVSAAGAHATVGKLLPERERSAPWAQRISAIRPSPPYISLYLGIEGDLRAAGGTSPNKWFLETCDSIRDWDVADLDSFSPMLFV